jgi:hypothetical protein
MDDLLAPAGVTILRASEKGRRLEPRVNPNEVALELFRELGASVRRIDDKLDLARDELAEIRGAGIPDALATLSREHADHKARLAKLEEAARTATAVAKPWWWFGRELVKPLIASAVGAAAALLAIKGAPSP